AGQSSAGAERSRWHARDARGKSRALAVRRERRPGRGVARRQPGGGHDGHCRGGRPGQRHEGQGLQHHLVRRAGTEQPATAGARAMAGKDPLAGGSTTLALKLPKKVKVSAISPAKKTGKKTVKFKIASGSMDPVTCTGSEKLKGGMKFKYKGKKVKVTKVKAA